MFGIGVIYLAFEDRFIFGASRPLPKRDGFSRGLLGVQV